MKKYLGAKLSKSSTSYFISWPLWVSCTVPLLNRLRLSPIPNHANPAIRPVSECSGNRITNQPIERAACTGWEFIGQWLRHPSKVHNPKESVHGIHHLDVPSCTSPRLATSSKGASTAKPSPTDLTGKPTCNDITGKSSRSWRQGILSMVELNPACFPNKNGPMFLDLTIKHLKTKANFQMECCGSIFFFSFLPLTYSTVSNAALDHQNLADERKHRETRHDKTVWSKPAASTKSSKQIWPSAVRHSRALWQSTNGVYAIHHCKTNKNTKDSINALILVSAFLLLSNIFPYLCILSYRLGWR